MDCRQVRALGDSYLDDELLVETNHAVLSHLDGCTACTADLQARRAMRTALKRAFSADGTLTPSAAFTPTLKQRLRPVGTKSGSARWLQRLPWMAAAAVAAAVTIQWILDDRRTASPMAADPAVSRLVESAVGDHRDCALRHQPHEPPVPLQQAGSYDPGFPGLDSVVESSAAALAPTAKTLGAHACVWNGRRFGHVVLSYKDATVSVLITRPDSNLRPYAEDTAAQCPTASEFAVACFAAPRHAVFVVSDLAPREAVTLAQGLAPTLRSHLSRVVVATARAPDSRSR